MENGISTFKCHSSTKPRRNGGETTSRSFFLLNTMPQADHAERLPMLPSIHAIPPRKFISYGQS